MSGKDAIKYKKTIYVLLLIFILLICAIAFLVFKRITEHAPVDTAADLQSSSPTLAVSPYTDPVLPEPEEVIITATPAPKWQSFAYPPLKGELSHSGDEDYRYSSIFCSSCAARYCLLVADKDAEGRAYEGRLPEGVNVQGVYIYGEFCPAHGKHRGGLYNVLSNETFTILAI